MGWQPLVVVLLLTQAVTVAVLGARAFGHLQALELLAWDLALAWRARADGPESPVWIVAVSDADIAGGDPTVSDGTLAEALRRILAGRPVVVGLDLLRGSPVPPGTADLEAALAGHDEIVVAAGYADRHEPARATRAPPAVVVDPARIGFADMDLDPDGVLRRGLLHLSGGEGPETALALRLAIRQLATEGIGPRPDGPHLRLGATTYLPLGPDDGGYAGLAGGGYQFLLSFEGCATGIPTLTIGELLDDAFDLGDLAGKVVLVGNQASDAKDLFTVPLDCIGGIERQVYGVTVHAQIVRQLIAQAHGVAPLQTLAQVLGRPWLGRLAEAAWTWAWAMLGGLAVALLPGGRSIVLAGVAGAGLLIGGSLAALATLSWWLPVVPAALAGTLSMALALAYALGRERQHWAMLLDQFAAYVSARVADLALSGRTGPEELVATVMFADIRGSTAISERLPERELLDWLNEYMAEMADLVLDHGGAIEKFAGDGITASFGSSQPRPDQIAADARAAVDCALSMGAALVRLNRTWRARGLPEIGTRIGIHTGPLIAGDLGSAHRKQYSIIGDTANTAARLESYGKDDPQLAGDPHHCRILISAATSAHLGDGYATEPVGALTLRGKAQPVAVLRVLAGPGGAAPLPRTTT